MSLLFRGGPAAVLARVWPVHINTIQSLSFRSFSQVEHKTLKPIPVFADVDAPSSVILVVLVILVVAALAHLTPASVCLLQTDAVLGARTYLLRCSDETARAALADNDPLGCWPNSVLRFSRSLAENQNSSEYFHRYRCKPLLDSTNSKTTATFAMSVPKVCGSDEGFCAASTSAAKHSEPIPVTLRALNYRQEAEH